MATLWAWATPAPDRDSPVDHTWVTDYDNRVADPPRDIAAVVKASGNYWYCWGDFHAHGEGGDLHGYLGNEPASSPVTRCLCEPNAPSASDRRTSGTIRHYGIDGICHQLANQLLWATGSHSQPPLTVQSARGYGASIFFYGTYGLQHDAWAARHANCSKWPVQPAWDASPGTAGSPSTTDDEFAEKAAAVLSARLADNKLPALLVLRRQAQEKLLAAGAQKHVSAKLLNELQRFFLGRASTLLNEAEFLDIFDMRAEDVARIELVDAPTFERARSPRHADDQHRSETSKPPNTGSARS